MPSSLIFCERSGDWAVSLGRHLVDLDVPIRQTRSLAECRQVLLESPGSLLVIEATAANVAEVLSFMPMLAELDDRARAVVVAQRQLQAWQWLLHEAGALCFVTSPRRLKPVAELTRRFFASQPHAELSFAERVWSQLPWKSAAASSQRRLSQPKHNPLGADL